MPRLKRVSPNSPGWTRRRFGRGFRYADEHGRPLDADQIARVRALAIPPAWRDVWICPAPNGHLQATGVDAAGRRQYLYHPHWRVLRDRHKFDRVSQAARLLPEARRTLLDDLARDGMPFERAAATAVRLLDLGYFRIGNDAYTDANGSFGLTTLERQHVRRRGTRLEFRFVGKSGIEHEIVIDDPDVVAALDVMRRRRGGAKLLAYSEGAGWRELGPAAVNSYLSARLGAELTAKDFRTWHATVIAAAALALSEEPGHTAASRKRAIRAAVVEVASYLGNTPTVARSSYIDPRILDLYESGVTIRPVASRAYRSPALRQAALEEAVLALLEPGTE